MASQYRTNSKGVYQARDICQHCGSVINLWHRCGTVPTIVVCDGIGPESGRPCPKCHKASGVHSFYGNVRLVPATAVAK